MIPTDIGPHPDAPDYYFPMGKPKDWDEADCGTLAVRRVGATGDLLHEPAARIVKDELPSGEVIYPSFLAEWEPTDEECNRILDCLMEGQKPRFRVLLAGNNLPPSRIWVKGAEEV